ncbi:MAG: hypothetical protein K5790_01700 [Nitrosopumilus sp.]|uniref:hypothetical protein n=1 Tax=Nitrosopumilus sp. TaxID=2024843 RepID=UPI00247F0F89|nr:hypothetical protein [Nitrosopumilus sp.]MCV0391988.1 hypothetical protein [Nitrosopumilus sp.]
MKYIVLLVLVGFIGIAFAEHDPNQSLEHSIILPLEIKEKTFDEFMEWCMPYYGEKCMELEKNRIHVTLSPLNQFKSGVPIDEIQCKENLFLIQKHDGSVACVSEKTKQKLIERNWITASGDSDIFDSVPSSDYKIKTTAGATHGSQYQVSGGTVNDVLYDEQSNSLTLLLGESEGGYLQIVMPSGLLYLPSDAPFVYSVTVDGKPTKFEKLSPILLRIPFEKNTQHIEIGGINSVSDSLDISNEERNSMLALGYKLFPGVGWIHMSNHTGIQNPIYRNHPDTGEQVLDIDSMIQVQGIFEKCDYAQKLRSGEIPAQNPDGSYNAISAELRAYHNGTNYIDSNTCKWADSLELLTYHCFEAKPAEQNWYFGPDYFDNGTHHLDRQYCEWEIRK